MTDDICEEYGTTRARVIGWAIARQKEGRDVTPELLDYETCRESLEGFDPFGTGRDGLERS